MWQLINTTPFAAEGFVPIDGVPIDGVPIDGVPIDEVPIDETGERRWGVVIKATVHVAPDGALSVAEEQLPPEHAPKYRGEPGISSSIYEQDVAADEPRADPYVNATAHALSGRPAAELAVGSRTPAHGHSSSINVLQKVHAAAPIVELALA